MGVAGWRRMATRDRSSTSFCVPMLRSSIWAGGRVDRSGVTLFLLLADSNRDDTIERREIRASNAAGKLFVRPVMILADSFDPVLALPSVCIVLRAKMDGSVNGLNGMPVFAVSALPQLTTCRIESLIELLSSPREVVLAPASALIPANGNKALLLLRRRRRFRARHQKNARTPQTRRNATTVTAAAAATNGLFFPCGWPP